MAKSKNNSAFWHELLSAGLYKRNQGRMTRQLTAVAIGLILFFASWTLKDYWLIGIDNSWVQIGIPTAIFAVGAWIIYRLVNYPRYADFLISVEAEMDKVSWASWPELYRSTIVVIGTMLFLGATLFVFDLIWQWLFEKLGVLQLP
jgi:preprotein translocase subunit SecE